MKACQVMDFVERESEINLTNFCPIDGKTGEVHHYWCRWNCRRQITPKAVDSSFLLDLRSSRRKSEEFHFSLTTHKMITY